VNEVTRTGRVVRTGRFMQARVIALVEHPAEDQSIGASSTRRRRNPNQQALI
jgi:hypothetical protein